MKATDLSGLVFGQLTVLRRIGSLHGKPLWLVRCTCGAEKHVTAANLRSGSTKSCGCMRNKLLADRSRTHGLSRHPMFGNWHNMRERCLREEHPQYADYGGRGIAIDARWVKSFSNFYNDMRDSYFVGATLDRIDNSAGYCRENCRWVTKRENNQNKRNTVWVSYRGRRRRLKELAESRGVDYSKVYYRYRHGYTIEQCLQEGRVR